MVSRSRTVNHPHGESLGVSIRASPNLDILGGKFDSRLTFEEGVFRVSQRIGILRLVKLVFVDTSMLLRWYYAFVFPIVEYCSPVWGSAAECLQPLELKVYSVARLCPDQTFLSLCHRCHVATLCMLYKVNRTRIIVYSVSFHLFLSEFEVFGLPPQIIHYSLKYQGVFCRPRLVYGMIFPSLCLTKER